MVKVRLTGKPNEVLNLLKYLNSKSNYFDLSHISSEYSQRNSRYIAVYVDLELTNTEE